MNTPPSHRRALAGFGLASQVAVLACGLLAAGAAERGGGAELLVPIGPGARAALPAIALDGHSRLIGAGLLPGSLVVLRDGGAQGSLLARGIVAIAVPLAICGAGASA